MPEERDFQAIDGAKNIEYAVKDGIVYLRFGLNKDFGPSSSGKTTIVATTSGNKTIPGTSTVIGVNAYRPSK